jgi:hypothetical protein
MEDKKRWQLERPKKQDANFFQPRRNATKLNDLDRLVETKTVKKDWPNR